MANLPGGGCFNKMSASIYLELKVFLIFLLHGAGLLFCSDLLRIFRKIIPHRIFWISLEDVIFWFAAGIWSFILIFIYQDGILRLYMAVAAGTGMYTYRKTVSVWLSRFFQKIDIIRQKTIAKNVERE